MIKDTPMAREQEKVVVNKIMDLLNNNKYDNLEELVKLNEKYSDFLKKQYMETTIKHFGNRFTDEEYAAIINNLRQLTKDKMDFDKEGIKSATFGDETYNIYENKEEEREIQLVNNSDEPIEEELNHKQQDSSEFQTVDPSVNTGRMFSDMEKHEKESLNLHTLLDINVDFLNESELEIYNVAQEYQELKDIIVRLDVQRGVIIDPENNVFKVEKEDEKLVMRDENGEKVEYKKDRQLTYTLNTNINNAA